MNYVHVLQPKKGATLAVINPHLSAFLSNIIIIWAVMCSRKMLPSYSYHAYYFFLIYFPHMPWQTEKNRMSTEAIGFLQIFIAVPWQLKQKWIFRGLWNTLSQEKPLTANHAIRFWHIQNLYFNTKIGIFGYADYWNF